MPTYTASTDDEFRDLAWRIKDEPAGEATVVVAGDIAYCHAIRFAADMNLVVEGAASAPAVLRIQLSPARHTDEHRLENETTFFFGGQETSTYTFRNLRFHFDIKDGFGEPLPGVLIGMDIMHDSKVVFENCIFEHGSADSIVIIRVMHNASVIFRDCRYSDGLRLEQMHGAAVEGGPHCLGEGEHARLENMRR